MMDICGFVVAIRTILLILFVIRRLDAMLRFLRFSTLGVSL